MDNRKKVYIAIGAIAIIVLVLGVSFALWNVNIAQEGINKLETDCFKIEFTDKNPISLSNAYPIEDELGMMQTPYTFTMTNVCNGSAKYQINLETMTPSGTKMPDKYLKVNLSEGNISKKTTKLDKSINSSLDTEPTIDGAIEAYKLVSGIMGSGETKEFNLRIWMDSEVTQNDPGSTNTRFLGRISITSSYFKDKRGTLMLAQYNDTNAFYNYRSNITKVIFEDKILPKETELSWDVSEEQNGSVMSYLVQNEGEETYTLYISSNGGIKANKNSSFVFCNFSKLISIEGLEYFDTKDVTSMYDMFYKCSSLTNLDVSNFNTSNVTSMLGMFYNCSSLTSLDVSNFDTNIVTNMSGMFYNCSGLTNLDLRNFDTSSVTNMENMFMYCTNLINLNVSSFNTSNVTTMASMFNNCINLTSLDVKNFNTSNVTNISRMFYKCSSLTNLDLSSFDTSKVIAMTQLFMWCSSLTSLDLNNFSINKVTDLVDMFFNMPTNILIYVKDETIQNWILTLDNNRPTSWTTENVIIK